MKKIVYLVTEDWYFVSHRLVLAMTARDAGYAVTVITNCNSDYKKIMAEGMKVVQFKMDRSSLNLFTAIKEIYGLIKIFKKINPDIIHNVSLRPVVVGGFAAKLAGFRNIVSAINGLGYVFTGKNANPIVRFFVKSTLHVLLRSGVTIVQNNDDYQFLCNLSNPKKQNIKLVPGSGVDVAHFSLKSVSSNSCLVMMASRLLFDKGLREFIEASKALSNEDMRFVIVGKMDHENPTGISVAELDVLTSSTKIEVWGFSDDIALTLSKADIFCLPSYGEGMPKVLLEAMASELACITTDVPGCREAVEHGVTGLIIPPRNSAALAEAIRNLFHNIELRRQMGIRGRKRVLERFSVDRVIKSTLNIYASF
jgi:glycosyltransferase involved in cell wall biosynthesis